MSSTNGNASGGGACDRKPPPHPVSPALGPVTREGIVRTQSRRMDSEDREAAAESRRRLRAADRIVIKAGTSVVSDKRGYPSLSRLGAIVEQCAWLRRMGKEVILVSSGAVGVGRQLLRRQAVMNMSINGVLDGHAAIPQGKGKAHYDMACAAAGQLGLMSLYETLFQQCDVATSQLLVTEFDFRTPERKVHIEYTLNTMLSLGVIPIINENDAVSGNEGYTNAGSFSDNDGLAGLVAHVTASELLLLLTDVDGVYDKSPSSPGAKVISTFLGEDVEIGAKSAGGRGGMQAKINAAQAAVNAGVADVIIANGTCPYTIEQVMCGELVGTHFCKNAKAMAALDEADLREAAVDSVLVKQAQAARDGGRALCALSSAQRSDILKHVASSISAHTADILHANERDLQEAKTSGLAGPLLKRLALTPAKIQTLVSGISRLADVKEPIGECKGHLEVSDGLVLKQVTAPIGVLLIVFESRPDSLPQIASLALRSGNGLLLKGGKEAHHSNAALHKVIVDAVFSASGGAVSRDCIGLVVDRAAIGELLKLDNLIDLVIPRGSGALVNKIKESTRIPVLGHAEGVCHVYVDAKADQAKACRIVVDSKVDYPAACNACETILLHEVAAKSFGKELVEALRAKEVTILVGPKAKEMGLAPGAGEVESFKTEYGDLQVSLEVVSGMDHAIDHIHQFGSGHTESIVTEDSAAAQGFLERIDAACAFHNSSTRFADGFRFGLGAEVGISTGRIHARGPVGVEGLLTTKWVLRSSSAAGDVVGDYSGENAKEYTHAKLPLSDGV